VADEINGGGESENGQDGEPQSEDVCSGFDSFKQWMNVHVSYFEALRILSLKTRNRIETSLILSNPHNNSAGGPLNWHRVIRNLCYCVPKPLSVAEANRAIVRLQEFLDSNSPQSGPLLVHFGKSPTNGEVNGALKPGEVKFIGRDHCEGVAGACSHYPEMAAPTDLSLQEKVYYTLISLIFIVSEYDTDIKY